MKIIVILLLFSLRLVVAQSPRLSVDPNTLLADCGTPGHAAFLDDSEFEYLNFEPVYSTTSATFYITDDSLNAPHSGSSTLSKANISLALDALKKGSDWAKIASTNKLTVSNREICRLPTSEGNLFVVSFHSTNGKSQISLTLGYVNDPTMPVPIGQTLYFYPESIPLVNARFSSALTAMDALAKQWSADAETSKQETAKANALLK